MPLPDEVPGSWDCRPNPDGRVCKQAWQFCEDCDGIAGDDEKCSTCTGSGGGYICAVHDGVGFVELIAGTVESDCIDVLIVKD